ncbi:serine-rich adhesin for platelets [Fundulus heteroclitus]|uniref:serine-rich adhesin for platelets n=1 Tax=Fundulus heteroclitus TaxID=8078 RepID=UPI00165A5D7A|nr:serine-rich adhesin for platelets [Fundulus heteroclitus]
MSTPLNVTKPRKDFFQVECDAPGEVEPSNTPVSTDPDAHWGTEPNFNLNLNLSSPSNPRPTKEPSKMHSTSKKEDKSKGGGKPDDKAAINVDFSTISLPGEKLKSKIPTISGSSTTETTVKNKASQQPKCPNIKHLSTPKMQIHGNTAQSPKQNTVELNHSQRSTEKVKTGIPKPESANPLSVLTPAHTPESANNVASNPKTQSNRKEEGGKETSSQTLQLPKSHNVGNQKGDKSGTTPQQTNPIPTMITKTRKTDLLNSNTAPDQKVGVDSKTQGILTTPETSQKEKKESLLLHTKPSQVTSPSPTSSTQRDPTGTRSSNISGSKENLHCKDLKAASGSKIGVKSSASSKSTEMSMDSLDSKVSSKCRSQTGSRDTLDSKSSSASKSSLDSRNSLDSKTPQSSKISPNSKFRIGSRDKHDSKVSTETRIKKSHQSTEKVADAQTIPGSKTSHSSKHLQKSKANFNPKIKTSTGSDPKSGSTQSTSPATLQASAFNMDLLGSVSLSPISSGSIKTTGSAVELSLNPKSQCNLSNPGEVWSLSKSTLIDCSSSLRSQSPGSSTEQIFASTLTGSISENQKSPSTSPAILAPLASSSPKTRPLVTSNMLGLSTDTAEPSAVIKKDPSISSQNTSLTRGLTFDSITKPGNNADKEHLKSAESKVNTQGDLEVSEEANNDREGRLLGDNGRKSVPLLSNVAHPGDTNIIASPRATSARKQKLEVCGKKNEVNPSSPHRPISSSSCHTPTKKTVKEAAAKTELTQRLPKRPGEQKEVGVQVEVEVVERSASTSPSLQWGAPTSFLIGSPSFQSSLSCTPPLKHVCQIEIELCSQTLLPCVVPEKASSLPACLRSYSFQQNPSLMSELGQNHNPDVSAESIWEDETEDEEKRPEKVEEDGFRGQTDKPAEVLWDKQGMTWEVYGASVDLESLGTAIQSHLEMKIREKERHIRILRKSICSNSSFNRYKLKKRRRRFLGCCVKASTVAD